MIFFINQNSENWNETHSFQEITLQNFLKDDKSEFWLKTPSIHRDKIYFQIRWLSSSSRFLPLPTLSEDH